MKRKNSGIKQFSILMTSIILLTLLIQLPPVTASAAAAHTKIIGMRIGSPLALLNGNAAAYDSQGTKPVILKGRTLLPLRFVSEKIGARVKWTSNSKPIDITMNGKKVSLSIGSKKMTIIKNGKTTTKTLDSPATLYNGRTLVPIRAISEALGFKVHYEKVSGIPTVVVSDFSLTQEKRGNAHRIAQSLPLTPVKKSGDLKMNKASANVKTGKILQLTAKPQSAGQTTALTWSTNNKAAATVDVFGVVTGHKNGRAVITAKSAGGKSVTCTVTVGDYDPDTIPVEKVTLDKKALTLMIWSTQKEQDKYGAPGDSYGSKGVLYEEVTPWYATDTRVTWKSDNSKVATVDKNGIVTGKSVGTANISATSHNGKSAICKVTVKANVRACVYDKALSDQVFTLANSFRAENGVPELKYNELFAGYAYRQAEYNAVHDVPDKANHSGYQIGCWGGLYSNNDPGRIPKLAVDSWKNSPAHRANLLSDYGDPSMEKDTDGGCAVFLIKVNGVVEEYVCILDFDYVNIENGAYPHEDPGISK